MENSNNINVQINVLNDNSNISKLYSIKVLKPNFINGENILTQDMIDRPDTKYIIRWNYIIEDNNTIIVPQNSFLEFNGGSISGGTITGNDTVLIYDLDKDSIFNNVLLQGTWKEKTNELADWNEENVNSPSYIKNKPNISQVPVQEQVDYNNLINKPEFKTINNESILGSGNINIESETVLIELADWNEENADSPSYIKNKPNIQFNLILSNWSETNQSSKSYIWNKPLIYSFTKITLSNYDSLVSNNDLDSDTIYIIISE